MEPQATVSEMEPVAPAPSGLGLRGLIEVFYKPSEFFAEIKQHPRVLTPYLAVLIGVFISTYFLADYIAEIQIEAMRANPSMNPSQIPTAEQMKPFIYIGGTVMWLLYPLITAGLGLLIGNFFMGGKAGFKQVLSVMLYGAWVFTLLGLLTVPLVLAKDSLYVGLSLGVLVAEPDFTDPLYLLLTKFSIQEIWEILAAGIGLSVIYGFSRNKGYITAVLSIGLIAMLHVLQTALFG